MESQYRKFTRRKFRMRLTIPIGVFLLFFLLLRKHRVDRRRSTSVTAVLCDLCTLSTEALSLPLLLMRSPIWLAVHVGRSMYWRRVYAV